MTEPGGEHQVGSIIAFLVMDGGDWSRGVTETTRDADRIGPAKPEHPYPDQRGDSIAQLVPWPSRRPGPAASHRRSGSRPAGPASPSPNCRLSPPLRIV